MKDENIPNETTDAGLDELRRRNEELKDELRMRDARENMTAKLAASGARSPGLLFDVVRGEIVFADDGTPANIPDLIAGLRRRAPEQFGRDAAAETVNAGAGTVAGSNMLTPESLAKMSPAEIAKLDWAAVREVLASSK